MPKTMPSPEAIKYVEDVWGIPFADLEKHPDVVEAIQENADDDFLERHGDNRLDKEIIAYLGGTTET